METRRFAGMALIVVTLVGCSTTKTIGSPGVSTTTVDGAATTATPATEPPTESTIVQPSSSVASSTTTTLAPLPPLQVGSTGPAVQALQEALLARGYTIDTDGIFGPATRSVVASYQGSINLAADGVAGPVTLAALGLGQYRTGDYASLDALLAEVLDYLNTNDAGALPADIVASIAWFVYTSPGITPFTIVSVEPDGAGSVQVSFGGADQQGTGPYVILQLCFAEAAPFTWCGLWGAFADGGDY